MMTSQVGLHSNDMLPYSFRLPRPTPQDHGIVSQYANSMMRATNPFEIAIEGGGEQGARSGYQGLTKPMAATFLDTFESFGDPDLCVTPEKPTPKLRRTLRDPTTDDECENENETESDQTPPRTTKHKVRFDQNVEIKHMSPEYLGNWGDGSSPSSQSPQQQIESGEDKFKKNLEPSRDAYEVNNYRDYIEINGAAAEADDEDDLEPISVVASDLRETTKTKSKKENVGASKRKVSKPKKLTSKPKKESQRSSSSRESSPLQSAASSVMSLSDGTTESVFARPEFHTTLRLSKEMKQLQEEELDLSAAVKQKLEVSGKTRTQIQEKASVRLNTETSLFSSLIPVDVKEDSLVHYVEREESAKAKSALITRPKMPEELEGQEPDIMEFFTPDLQRETASYSVEGFPHPLFGPCSADPMRAFDVYRHIRSWEGW